MDGYESVLGIPWESSESDAECECYFTYVLERYANEIASPESEHSLNSHDIDDMKQHVFIYAQRCIKYFKPDKGKISTFVTMLIQKGISQFLKSRYGREQKHVPFSQMPEEYSDQIVCDRLQGRDYVTTNTEPVKASPRKKFDPSTQTPLFTEIDLADTTADKPAVA